MNIAFIGLGIMGKAMAKNLIKAGHDLVVYNRSKAAVEEVVAAGGRAAASPRDAAACAEVIITMLPDAPDVKQVVLGENGVLEGAREGTVFIDMSSIAPGASQELAAACAKKGVEMSDAPVSGGEPKAIDGTLSIMVGGKEELFEAVKEPILLKMGSAAVYCGAIGAGNTTKLVNQVLVGCNIAACAEAFMLARQAGVSPERVLEAVRGGLAGSAVLDAKVPMILEGDFVPGFKIDLHIKDFHNVLETGHDLGAPLPLTAMVMEMMQVLHVRGRGSEDHSALAAYYELLTGTEIGAVQRSQE